MKLLKRLADAMGVLGIGHDEIGLLIALGLLSAGLHQVWPPGAYIAPAIILLWIVLPSRAPLVSSHRDGQPGVKQGS